MSAPLRFAVVGDPVAHSLSPAMHAAAYRALGLAHTYEAIRATAEELPAVIAALRSGDLAGVNVTVPHKRLALELSDEVSPGAQVIGAANTLVRQAGGRIAAHNTDAPALAAELRALVTAPPGPRPAGGATGLVLGAGGAARAAAVALVELGAARVAVRARDRQKAHALVSELRTTVRRDANSAAPIFVDEPWAQDPSGERGTRWVVQATSAGMTGNGPGHAVAEVVAWASLPRDAAVIDVVYSPVDTPLLGAARRRGLANANGLGMLARQGALAFELWLGTAPYEAMRAALTTT